MNARQYTRYLERKASGYAPPVWPLKVYARIMIEAAYWCSGQVALIFMIEVHLSGYDVRRETILCLITSLALFILSRYGTTHVIVSIGRLIALAVMWLSIYILIQSIVFG